MIDIAGFLTSELAIYIYISIIIVCGIGVLYHLINKNSYKRKQKQNTKELNDILMDSIEEKINSPIVVVPEKKKIEIEEPVIIIDNDTNKNVDIVSSLTEEKTKENLPTKDIAVEPANSTPTIIEKQNETIKEEKQEELVYAPIELNKEEAMEELERITKELTIRQELEEKLKEEEIANHVPEVNNEEKNIILTNFEKEQEENAIISIDELMSKANAIYTQNEDIQYEDEGNEPISIADLQAKWEAEQQMIKQIEKEEKEIQIIPVIEEKEIKPENSNNIKQVQFPSILPQKKEAFTTNFESSPIISPIYGIDREKTTKEVEQKPMSPQELQLENTANYEKFDEEIRKTNEFIAALKELQKKLD